MRRAQIGIRHPADSLPDHCRRRSVLRRRPPTRSRQLGIRTAIAGRFHPGSAGPAGVLLPLDAEDLVRGEVPVSTRAAGIVRPLVDDLSQKGRHRTFPIPVEPRVRLAVRADDARTCVPLFSAQRERHRSPRLPVGAQHCGSGIVSNFPPTFETHTRHKVLRRIKLASEWRATYRSGIPLAFGCRPAFHADTSGGGGISGSIVEWLPSEF